MDSTRLHKLLELHEGLRLKPYKCTAGKTTIGIGRNLDDKGITKAEAYALLKNDIFECQFDMVSFPWFQSLDDVRQTVLLDMRFNLGPQGIRKFKGTLGAVAAKDYSTAARSMLQSLWAKQVGVRARRLSEMMRTGEWPSEIL